MAGAEPTVVAMAGAGGALGGWVVLTATLMPEVPTGGGGGGAPPLVPGAEDVRWWPMTLAGWGCCGGCGGAGAAEGGAWGGPLAGVAGWLELPTEFVAM